MKKNKRTSGTSISRFDVVNANVDRKLPLERDARGLRQRIAAAVGAVDAYDDIEDTDSGIKTAQETARTKALDKSSQALAAVEASGGNPASAAIAASASDVGVLFGKHTKNKERIECLVEALTEVITSLGSVAEQSVLSGTISSGDALEDLRHGVFFLNGKPYNVRSILVALVMMRAAVVVEEFPGDTTYMTRLSSNEGPAIFFSPGDRIAGETSVITNILSSGDHSKWNAAKQSHVLVIKRSGKSGYTTAAWVPIADAFENPRDGEAFPELKATYANPNASFIKDDLGIDTSQQGAWASVARTPVLLQTARFFKVRNTHDVNGILQVAAAIGITSLDSALANLAPLGSNTIGSLLKVAGGPDLVTSPLAK